MTTYKDIKRIIKVIILNKWFYPFLFFLGYAILYFLLRDEFLFTPDFVGTDVFHFNISYKYYLWKSIRSGIIPLWTDKLNGGFPLIAESQMGIFYLPHYLIFPFFVSFSHAYTFLFLFHLFLLTIGMYFLLQELKIRQTLSFLLSIIFAWNGSITFRWVHFTVLQAFSFTPLLFLCYFKWKESLKNKYLIILSLLLNQMIYSGYIQSVFIAVLGLGILYFIQNYPLDRKKTSLFFCFLFLGICLSLPQILPTLQLSQYTSRSLATSYEFAVSVPFNTANLCAFFSANCLGSAKNGSYSNNWQKNGIYWENTPYVGELFFFVLVLASIYILRLNLKNKSIYTFLVLFFLFLLLALGKNSPLYFLFSIFPFSIFRTPPRYLLIAVFFLVIHAALILQQIIKKHPSISLVIYIILLLNCVILIRTAFAYHLFINSSEIYHTLNTKKKIKPGSFYITFGAQEEWSNLFLKQGWNSKKSVEEYIYMASSLLPNSNLISDKASFDIYTSLDMRRQRFLKSILTDGLNSATDKYIESSQSARVENILELYNINSIISFKKLYLPHFKAVQRTKRDGILITTYQDTVHLNPTLFYVPNTVTKIMSVEELQDTLHTSSFTLSHSIVEATQKSIPQNNPKVIIHLENNSDQYMKSSITSKGNTYVAVRKNWYPDWRLYIDGTEHVLYRTNLIHMGFFVPDGTHTIELKYVPESFYIGCLIALLVPLGTALYFLKSIERG